MQDLRQRTREFAIRIVRLYKALPRSVEAQIFGKQLLRSETSVGAHYREACRAKSGPDFVSKLEGALQELDETGYWLELLRDTGIVSAKRLLLLQNECDELIAMFVSMVRTAKRKAGPR
jgi:four helix bundle protein